MAPSSKKEKDAIVRMMIYIKYELARYNLDEEARKIDEIIESTERRFEAQTDDT